MKTIITLLPLTVALLAVSTHAQEDQLPPTPAGQTWKLVWQDEFDGTTLDASKWDTPEYKRRDGYWSRKAISLDGNGHLVMSTLKDGDKYLGRLRADQGQVRARLRLLRRPHPTSEAAGPLVGVLDHGRRRRQGRRRGA